MIENNEAPNKEIHVVSFLFICKESRKIMNTE